MHSSVIFRFQKYVKKRVHGNEKINLLCAFKKVRWIIFRCQKYVKKRVYGNEKMDLPCAFFECTRSLHFTLLIVQSAKNAVKVTLVKRHF